MKTVYYIAGSLAAVAWTGIFIMAMADVGPADKSAASGVPATAFVGVQRAPKGSKHDQDSSAFSIICNGGVALAVDEFGRIGELKLGGQQGIACSCPAAAPPTKK